MTDMTLGELLNALHHALEDGAKLDSKVYLIIEDNNRYSMSLKDVVFKEYNKEIHLYNY